MAGGKRPGAGRKKGIPNKATLGRQAKITASGTTPLDFLIEVMRSVERTFQERFEAAKAAAPYVHPRLSAVESKAEVVHTYVARMPAKVSDIDEWKKRYAPERPVIQ